ncbi:MAG: hypothetical protein ACT4OX_08525 [Actinomycetota bacterium]
MSGISDPIEQSGCEDFDRARALLADAREEEALDWFEVASTTSEDPVARGSACAYAAGLLLSLGRPWEVAAWAEMLRTNGGNRDLAALLEAAAELQLEEVERASALLAEAVNPSDPWFPCSPTSARIVRAHAAYLLGDEEGATREVMDAFADDPFAPDVWDAFARLCAETEFDPGPVVAHVPEDRVLGVLAALKTSEPAGVDRIAELIWERAPNDSRVLALVPSFAAKLESVRAMHWSARLRAAGMGRLCPLAARSDDIRVTAPERVRAAALVHASFGDKRGRESIELAVAALADDEIAPALDEVWTIAPALTDSVVVAGASTTRRSLRIAAGLFAGGAVSEAYSVLVHGLAMEDAETLTTEDVVALVPVGALEGLAATAEARGEQDVAGILEAVAVVAVADTRA